MNPYLSVVIPVFNESGNLEKLFKRLTAVLDKLDRTYEIIFTNDGSKDSSMQVLEKLYKNRPKQVKVIDFCRNFGQHMAVIAGFELAKGDVVVTLDSDLQNPPEEIPKLLKLIDAGHDLVTGIRLYERKDSWFRRNVSIVVNKVRAIITNLDMTDHGCMLKAYSRNVIDLIIASNESSLYIPALAQTYAVNPAEVEVDHAARFEGRSKYRLYDLIRLNFDLMTGYSVVPLQIFTLFGFGLSILSILFMVFLLIRRFIVGPEVEGVFTLFAILFFFIGVVLMGLGIVGEYVGRIYKEVRRRPRFAVRKVLGVKENAKNSCAWH